MGDSEMNKAIAINAKSDKKAFHQVADRIRQEFLGQGSSSRKRQLRVILYSHDTMGVGHMRRNLLIAGEITRKFPNASVLVVAGAKEANTFAQRSGIDCLTLPAFLKNSNGTYSTRNLGISASDVLKVRSETILAAVKSFKPDLFIVDKVPAGAGGELIPSLKWLSSETTCRCVLGLRDILDSPKTVQKDWRAADSNRVLRQYYSAVWIYGDPDVYDAVTEYEFPEDIAEMATYTGYLNTESRLKDLNQLPYEIEVPYVLCTVGGGQDGEQLAYRFVQAMKQSPQNAVLLTGPYMPTATAESLKKQSEDIPMLKVVEFVDEGDLLVRNASHVISMGGYNTVAAILSHRKTALIVPRCVLRQEQLIRAEVLANKGLITAKHADELQPEFINHWLRNPKSPCIQTTNLNMNGLSRISEIIERDFKSLFNSQVSINGRRHEQS